MWAADVETKQGVVRAEYTYDQEFQCDDARVTETYADATLFQNLAVRAINTALGSIFVERDNPESVAALVLHVMLAEPGDVKKITFYGTGYLPPKEPEATTLGNDDGDVMDQYSDDITMVRPLPKSKFGFDRVIATKSLATTLYEMGSAEIAKEIATIEIEIAKLQKAKSQWARQPHREYHAAIVEYFAPKMASALLGGVTGIQQAIDAARRKYLAETVNLTKAPSSSNASNLGPGDAAALAAASRSAANAAVQAHVNISPGDANNILNYIYGNGYITGAHSAVVQIGGTAVVPQPVANIEEKVDWSIWGPSESRAANLVRDGGLSDLLEQSGTIIQGIFDTVLDRLGNAIAYGLDNGLSTDQIASNISTVDPETRLSLVSENADVIAVTETSRAQSAATFDTYQENGIGQYNWLAEDTACLKCMANADGGPYSTDEEPDPSQPAHPNCRCTYIPVVTDEEGNNLAPTSDEGDQSIASDGGSDQSLSDNIEPMAVPNEEEQLPGAEQ